jgi:hypothetical protein
MSSLLLSGRAQPDATIADAGVIFKARQFFSMNTSLADLARALDHESYALIVTEQRCFTTKRKKSDFGDGNSVTTSGTPPTETSRVRTRSVVSGIVTRIDLLDYVSSGTKDKHNH